LPGGVAHYTFLDTCGAAGKTALPVYCPDAAGVDRDQVHVKVSVWRWSSSTRTCAELLGVEERVVDIGPELFEGKVGAIDEAAGEPLLADFGPGAVFGGVVEGRDAGGRA
jgi:hypothetical protein